MGRPPKEQAEPKKLTLQEALAQGYSLAGKQFIASLQRQYPNKKYIAIEDVEDDGLSS